MPDSSGPGPSWSGAAAIWHRGELRQTNSDITYPCSRPDVPTFADYIPVVEAAVTPGTLRVYGSYWKRINQRWGDRRLDEPTATEIAGLVEHTKQNRVQRRNGRGGSCAGEHMVAAFRCLYKFAVIDDYISASTNPAAKVPKPRRLPSNRRGLPAKQINELVLVASSTGNDPALDALIVRFHLETAARRAAALKLRRMDIDEEQCLLLLQEKAAYSGGNRPRRRSSRIFSTT